MRFLSLSVLLLLFFAGCGKDRGQLINASDEFRNIFLNQLRNSSTVDTTSGRADYGDVFLNKSEFVIHNDAFNLASTYQIGRAALSSWKEYEDFEIKTSGGGGNHFFIHYGNNNAHVFIDIISYRYEGRNKIDYLVRAN